VSDGAQVSKWWEKPDKGSRDELETAIINTLSHMNLRVRKLEIKVAELEAERDGKV
jgi:hypothetical protein